MAWGSPLPDDSTRSNATQRDREAKIPRNGSGIYSKPAGTTAVASTTIESAKYNSVIDDLVTDANTPRPVVAGGTGATSLAGLLAAIGGQPLDADLTAIAALGYTSGAYLIKKTAAGTFSLIALTAAGEALLDDADAAAQRTTMGLGALATAADVSTAEMDAGTLVTAADTLASNDNDTTIPTSAAVIDYVPVAMNASGSAPMYACRAWVNFNGQGAVSIRGSGNVTSITDNGTGNYTVNFTTAMPDANFATVVAASRVGADGYAGVANNRTTASVSVLTYEAGNFADQAEVSVAVFR